VYVFGKVEVYVCGLEDVYVCERVRMWGSVNMFGRWRNTVCVCPRIVNANLSAYCERVVCEHAYVWVCVYGVSGHACVKLGADVRIVMSRYVSACV